MQDEVLVRYVNALPIDDISPLAKAAMMHEPYRLMDGDAVLYLIDTEDHTELQDWER